MPQGTGGDADIYYDGTDLRVNPRVVGTGMFKVHGGTSQPMEVTSTAASTHFIVSNESETQNNDCALVFNATKDQTAGSANSTAYIQSLTTNDGGALTGDIRFFTNGGDSNAERMRITSTGSVGVGDLSAYSGGTSDPAGAPPTGSTNAKVLKIDGGLAVDAALQISGHSDIHGLDIWTDVTTGDVYFDQRGNHDTYDFRFRTKTTGTPVNAFTITGAGVISKASGSFKIDHPLPEKTDTHHLVHSFVEGPQADLLYRGTATLSSGTATVNIDTAARMTDGTFVALNGNVQAFTTNETAFDNVRALVSGNILTITSEDNTSTATISWLVVGERKDAHMVSGGTTWTDSDGRVITEPLKEEDADRMTPARQAAEAEAAAEAKITALESA